MIARPVATARRLTTADVEIAMDAPVTKASVAEYEGITRQSFQRLVERYVPRPLMPAGHLPPNRISYKQALAIVVAREIRQRERMSHASRETAMQAFRMLDALSPDEITEHFAEGRTCIAYRDYDVPEGQVLDLP